MDINTNELLSQALDAQEAEIRVLPGVYTIEQVLVDDVPQNRVVDWSCCVVLDATEGQVIVNHRNLILADGLPSATKFPSPIIVEGGIQELRINMAPVIDIPIEERI